MRSTVLVAVEFVVVVGGVLGLSVRELWQLRRDRRSAGRRVDGPGPAQHGTAGGQPPPTPSAPAPGASNPG